MRALKISSIFSSIQAVIRKAGTFFFRPTAFFVVLAVFSIATFISVSASDAFSGKNIFQDTDSDGLTNEEERLYATDPFNKDSDGDGYSDGVEIQGGYDPLKKAPGDKIVLGGSSMESDSVKNGADAGSKENLTKKVSTEVARLVQEKGTGNDISLDDVDSAVSIALGGGEEVVLPEILDNEIKIKLLSKKDKKLSDEERKKKEEEYIVEYLTAMAYIVANNSPSTFQSENELKDIATSVVDQSNQALLAGDFSYIADISKNGEKMLEQIQGVEVPEPMLELHLKALRMAKYGVVMKDELLAMGDATEDPLRSIATISKLQGFLTIVIPFVDEFQAKLTEYGITDIPLDI